MSKRLSDQSVTLLRESDQLSDVEPTLNRGAPELQISWRSPADDSPRTDHWIGGKPGEGLGEGRGGHAAQSQG